MQSIVIIVLIVMIIIVIIVIAVVNMTRDTRCMPAVQMIKSVLVDPHPTANCNEVAPL